MKSSSVGGKLGNSHRWHLVHSLGLSQGSQWYSDRTEEREGDKGRKAGGGGAEAQRGEEGRGGTRRTKKKSTAFFLHQSQRTSCSTEENIHIHNLPWRENLT